MGTGHDLDDAKAKFRTASARIRAGLTGDIAAANRYAEASAEALARYGRKGGRPLPQICKMLPQMLPRGFFVHQIAP